MSKELSEEEQKIIHMLGHMCTHELEKIQDIVEKTPDGEDHSPYDYQRMNYHLLMTLMGRITVLTILAYPGQVHLGDEPGGENPPDFLSPFGTLPTKDRE